LIPRVFHQIWLGPAPLPDRFEPLVESWRRHHPGWTHRLWTEETLPGGLRPEVYERLRSPAERSDVLRLELLAREGGVYVDTDFECLRPLDPLLEGVELFAGVFKDGRVNNALLGAAAEHPAIVRALQEVRPLARYGTVDKYGTGPFFVDRVLKEAGATLFERKLFYPMPSEEPSAYAVHHMARSWKTAQGHRSSVLLADERLAATEAQLASSRLAAGARLRYGAARRWLDRARRRARHELAPHAEIAWARVGRRRPTATRVPRVLHHVWLEPGDLPRDVAARLESWRICHPDWTQRLWREEDLPDDLTRSEAADPLRSPAEREELIRLELIERHGGVAADLQLACRRRLDGAVAGLDAFSASSTPGVPDPALVGGVPGHPAFARALAAAEPFEWHVYPAGRTGGNALEAARGVGLVLLPPSSLRPVGLRARATALAAYAHPVDSLEERERLQREVLSVESRLRAAQTALARRRGGTDEAPTAASQRRGRARS
jgi:mannosyltransferase OCH1-like enzyme